MEILGGAGYLFGAPLIHFAHDVPEPGTPLDAVSAALDLFMRTS